ncbi:MAG TPA: C40 family peptidase [Acidimicrobiales bacterium]|jgi:cell wall-associated NlpC family hydrolase|nr:C40 family peptidase [Acidimicrobiales bacterium]
MAAPFLALIGLSVGALGTGAVLLGGLVTGVSIGPVGVSAGVGSTNVIGAAAATVALSAQLDQSPIFTPASITGIEQAAATCPGLDWTLLAGGVLIDPSLAASLTSAATDLCDATNETAALSALLPGPTEDEVALVLAHALAADPELTEPVATALTFAAANIGAPYRWGGTGSGGFDCSGLTLEAYRTAGIIIPRVAQDQFDNVPAVPVGSSLEPGDLVFFGSGPRDVSHVGLYIGGGQMIDAPHTGAFVRIEATPTTPGARFGDDVYVGATRPG